MSETLLSRWQNLVATDSTAIAVIDSANQVWHRGELDDAAMAWARTLPSGLRNRRVALALPNGGEWFVKFIGLLHAGAVPVPLDAAEPPAAQLKLAAAAGAGWTWQDDQLTPIAKTEAETHRQCLIKLTSGSTGRPRALAFTDKQMLADGRQICRTMDIRPDDRNFALIPLGHSYGLGNLVVPLLDQGTAIICAGLPLPHLMAATIKRWRATVFPAVPAVLRALAESEIAAELIGDLRVVISAGSLLTPQIARSFHERFWHKVHNFYGSSETGGIAYDRTGDAALVGSIVGTAIEGVAITVLPDDQFSVTSPAVFGDGSHQPSDLGRLTDKGELVLLGRSGRVVKIAGRRLDLAGFESELRELPGISDAHAEPHPENPEEIVLFLSGSIAQTETRALLRESLATWKIPRQIMVVKEFPRNARGKVDLLALRQLAACKP